MQPYDMELLSSVFDIAKFLPPCWSQQLVYQTCYQGPRSPESWGHGLVHIKISYCQLLA